MQSDHELALSYMGGSSVCSTPLCDTEQALETNAQHIFRVLVVDLMLTSSIAYGDLIGDVANFQQSDKIRFIES